MATYVVLMSLTDQGIRDIKSAPERIDQGIKMLEKMGGKLISFYVVMGDYDYVAIGEAPSDEIAAAFAFGLGAEGNVRTKTLKAFTKEEAAGILKQLP